MLLLKVNFIQNLKKPLHSTFFVIQSIQMDAYKLLDELILFLRVCNSKVIIFKLIITLKSLKLYLNVRSMNVCSQYIPKRYYLLYYIGYILLAFSLFCMQF